MVQAPYLILVFVHSIYTAFASKSLFVSSLINTGRIQYSGAVGISRVKTVIFCSETCKHNIKCMTFFYNTLSTECVLHSKTFCYQDPDQAENGWKMYLLTESKYYISVMCFTFICLISAIFVFREIASRNLLDIARTWQK